MTGSRSLTGLDLNNVLESGRGRSGQSTRSSALPTIMEEPEIPTVAQKDAQEIKQRLLNMYISSLGDMSEDEKKTKIAYWIVHYDKEQQPHSKGKEEEEKQDMEDKEQQPDSKGKAKEEKQPTEEKEEEEKQPAEEKNDDPQAKQPDNTAKEDMGEDEQTEKKPRTEESSPTEDTSSTPTEDPDPEEADAPSLDDSLSNHGSEPDDDSDGMDESVLLGSNSSH